MIPEKPQIITSPICYNGDKRAIPESTPLGSNQLSFESGFPVLTSTPLNAGGLPPDRQDFNAALNLLSTFIYYMQSGNQFAWNNQLDYNTGAFVIGSDNAVYFCIQANGATSPNTVQDPTSSTGYWVQILSSDGKLNVEALSITLGSFAQLNSLALTDNRITGILPTTKGGLGKQLLDTDASGIFSVQAPANTDLNTLYNRGIYTCTSWVNYPDGQTYNGQGTVINLQWNQSGGNGWGCQIFIAPDGAMYSRYRFNSAEFSEWVGIRNANGTIPVSTVKGLATVATSGSYNDLTNKPTIPTNVAPLPVTGEYGENPVGVWRSVFFSSVSNAKLPSGGTWAYFTIGLNSNGTIPVGSLTNNVFGGVAGGGTKLNFSSTVQFASMLCWRIQ